VRSGFTWFYYQCNYKVVEETVRKFHKDFLMVNSVCNTKLRCFTHDSYLWGMSSDDRVKAFVKLRCMIDKHCCCWHSIVLSKSQMSSALPYLMQAIPSLNILYNITRGPSSGWHSMRCCLDYPSPWPQCTVNLDRNLKPKLAIMRQCTSVTDRRTLTL